MHGEQLRIPHDTRSIVIRTLSLVVGLAVVVMLLVTFARAW